MAPVTLLPLMAAHCGCGNEKTLGASGTQSSLGSDSESESDVAAHQYYVAASWNNWDFEEMTEDDSAPGLFRYDVDLGKRGASTYAPDDDSEIEFGGEFQIVQDKDWNQVFHPPGPHTSLNIDKTVLGPGSATAGFNWFVSCEFAEVFRIQLQLPSATGNESPVVSCRHEFSKDEVGPAITASYINSLAACVAQSTWEKALLQLEDMYRWGGKKGADAEACRYGLHACGKAGPWQKVLEVLNWMWDAERHDIGPDAADYRTAIEACMNAGEASQAAKLQEEVDRWDENWAEAFTDHSAYPARFQIFPAGLCNRQVRQMGSAVKTTIQWMGYWGPMRDHSLDEPVPDVPQKHPCWLLPCTDEAAVELAKQQEKLRESGWKLLTCESDLVSRLNNKVEFRQLAESLGLSAYLPLHWDSPDDATYPCMLKPAIGEGGSGTRIVNSSADVNSIVASGALNPSWLLQELVPGSKEYSTSLLVRDGTLLVSLTMEYVYEGETFIWPYVRELSKRLIETPQEHRKVMEAFLQNYSGICNFNYKVRSSGDMSIFEVNPRIGGDLLGDVPKDSAMMLLQTLDWVHFTAASI